MKLALARAMLQEAQVSYVYIPIYTYVYVCFALLIVAVYQKEEVFLCVFFLRLVFGVPPLEFLMLETSCNLLLCALLPGGAGGGGVVIGEVD